MNQNAGQRNHQQEEKRNRATNAYAFSSMKLEPAAHFAKNGHTLSFRNKRLSTGKNQSSTKLKIMLLAVCE